MTWFSLKKFTPYEEDCLVRLQNKYNHDVWTYAVGYYSLSRKCWVIYGYESYQNNYNLEPTHFCMIPPIEIEAMEVEE